jgi:hypothetical protein
LEGVEGAMYNPASGWVGGLVFITHTGERVTIENNVNFRKKVWILEAEVDGIFMSIFELEENLDKLFGEILNHKDCLHWGLVGAS